MQNGTIIVLAWPEGMVKNADSWYDFFLSKNGMYRVGHSAIILINNELESINYFDFGRYHTPNGFGRVRDEVTDPDLKILTKPKIKNNKLTNLLIYPHRISQFHYLKFSLVSKTESLEIHQWST